MKCHFLVFSFNFEIFFSIEFTGVFIKTKVAVHLVLEPVPLTDTSVIVAMRHSTVGRSFGNTSKWKDRLVYSKKFVWSFKENSFIWKISINLWSAVNTFMVSLKDLDLCKKRNVLTNSWFILSYAFLFTVCYYCNETCQ